MKQKIKIYTISILAGFLFSGLVYIEDIEVRIIRYIIIFLFYFFLYLWLYKKFPLTNRIELIIVVTITPILIDASVYFSYPAMIPLRFPYSSLYPITGALLAFFLVSKRKTYLHISTAFALSFFYLSYKFFIPNLEYITTTNVKNAYLNSTLFESIFYDSTNTKFKLSELTKDNSCNLIECYFVGCSPCQLKEIELQKIENHFKGKSFKVIRICSGVATKFENFKKDLSAHQKNGDIYLYDKDSILYKSYNMFSYPYEILTSKDKIISQQEGFNKNIAALYFSKHISKIQKLLNE